MKEQRVNLDLLRQNSMVRILEDTGHSTKHQGDLYHSPFRPDNNPSLHINESKHVWHDFGDTTPDHVKPGQNCASGDVFDFVRLLLGYPLNVSRDSDIYKKGFAAAVDFLVSRTPGATIRIDDGRFDSSKLVNNLHKGPLKGYTIHSGGAAGADTVWGEEAAAQGADVRHYYHPDRKSPKGNVEISSEDITEGSVKAALAARRMYGYQYSRMKDGNIIRDWAQVKYAKKIFAVGLLLPAGSPFRAGSTSDDRKVLCDTVVGGTGYAVNMAILEKKPVCVFNQKANATYPVGWYEYDPDTEAFVQLPACPVLVKDSACIGSRELTEEGRKAIKDVVVATTKTRAFVSKVTKSDAASTIIEEKPARPVDSSRRVNIWAGSGENIILSNLARTPFVVGSKEFVSAEHYFQWRKAVLFGDDVMASRILAAPTGEEAKAIGRQVKGYDEMRWVAVRDAVMEDAVRSKMRACPEAMQALMETGDALLTHEQDNGHWREAFPAILMKVRGEYLNELEGELGEYRGEATYVIESVRQGISWKPLRDYMEGERGIGQKQLSRYCGEVRVHIEHTKGDQKEIGPSIVAVGFPNKSGGFELRKEPYVNKDGERVQGMKKCTSKDYTIIDTKGHFMEKLIPSSDTVYVFEGFTDFLSYLCWNGDLEVPDADCVILNSTSMARAAAPFMAMHGKVVCYLDNDNAGRETTSIIAKEVYALARSEGKTVTVQDGAEAYAGYKDINEAYCDTKQVDIGLEL